MRLGGQDRKPERPADQSHCHHEPGIALVRFALAQIAESLRVEDGGEGQEREGEEGEGEQDIKREEPVEEVKRGRRGTV